MKDKDATQPSGFYHQDQQLDWEDERWWQKTKKTLVKGKDALGVKKIALMIVVSVIALIYIVTASINDSPTQPRLPQVEEEQETTKPITELSQLQQEIKDLRAQLKQADPAIKETPFPEVVLDLGID